MNKFLPFLIIASLYIQKSTAQADSESTYPININAIQDTVQFNSALRSMNDLLNVNSG